MTSLCVCVYIETAVSMRYASTHDENPVLSIEYTFVVTNFHPPLSVYRVVLFNGRVASSRFAEARTGSTVWSTKISRSM